jgi:uncharacterized damage-inducible protein DinB
MVTRGFSGCIVRMEAAMKELFLAFASYNAKANAAVLGHVGAMGRDAVCRDYGTFYPTITDCLLHVMASDAKWLVRFAAFRDSPPFAERVETIKADLKADPAFAFADRSNIAEARTQLDAEIIALIASIPEAALIEDFEIAFGQGRIRRPLWQLLLQWFNHHTHHRGHISAMMDIAGEKHDFSLMLDKIG